MLFKEKFPSLRHQWHPENKLSFDSVTSGSNYQALWSCSLGHSWSSKISTITYKNESLETLRCPFCNHRKLLSGFNDLVTLNPALANEFHPSKNGNLTASDILYGSRIKLWWKCAIDHEWEATMVNRKNGTGCPDCYVDSRPPKQVSDKPLKRKPLPEDLVAEWDFEVNKDIEISKVSSGSGLQIGWVCKLGHKWFAQPSKRVYYNSGCPICANSEVLAGFNDLLTTHPLVAKQWHSTKNGSLSPSHVSYGSKRNVWWLCEQGHEWTAIVGKRSTGINCPVCFGSKGEEELYDFLSGNLDEEILLRNRSIIAPNELDIYLPGRNVAVEFNGLYWHSEANGKYNNYHYDKWLACKKLGIQLIQVWEDDWNHNPDIIRRMLAHKLSFSFGNKIFARKTVAHHIPQNKADLFLEENHIQGSVAGGIRIGLFDKETYTNVLESIPVAVMVLKYEPGSDKKVLNLLRFATSVNVVGGFTKLLKYVERELKPSSVVTFSDNTVSDGGLYENNGFRSVKELKPDYMYIVKSKRVHKFNYRLKRFREDPFLRFEENLSESELAILNNISRVWDAGKIKWEKLY